MIGFQKIKFRNIGLLRTSSENKEGTDVQKYKRVKISTLVKTLHIVEHNISLDVCADIYCKSCANELRAQPGS